MARSKYHHLYKRGSAWYFRKNNVRVSLETTIATEAIRKRDRMLENYRIHGQFFLVDNNEGLTFGQVAKEWAKIHSKRVKYSTWRDYRSAMNTHVLPAFKDYRIEAITYMDVENFISGLDCGPKRINNILVPMRSVFKMAFKNGYVKENVMLKVDNRSIRPPDIFPLTYGEVLLFLDSVEAFDRPYSAVRFFTGMRAGEIDALEWSDVRMDIPPRPRIHINKAFVYGQTGNVKTAKSNRYVDCLEPVVEALEQQRRLTGKSRHIFLTRDGRRMTPDHFRKEVWTPALEKAEIAYRPPLQTRHTFATMMISAGEDIGWVQHMMGHSSLQMIFTRYYAWMPKSTRNDGMAFMASISEKSDGEGGVQGALPAGQSDSSVFGKWHKNDTPP